MADGPSIVPRVPDRISRPPDNAAERAARDEWARILGDDLYSLASVIDHRDSDDSVIVTAWTAAWLARDLSDQTRSAYSGDIAAYFTWCRSRHMNPARAGFLDLERYDYHLREMPPPPPRRGPAPARYSKNTRARLLSTVASWYEYGLIREFIDRNPTRTITRPTLDKGVPRSHIADDVDRVMDIALHVLAPGDRVRSLTMAAVVAVGVDHGWRRAQLIGARIEDLTAVKGYAACVTQAKGRKEVTTVFTDRCRDLIRSLLVARGNPAEGPLFSFAAGRPMSPAQLWRILGRIGQLAGVAELTPHTLRRTLATAHGDAGIPLDVTADALGHASVDTTRDYYDMRRDDPDRLPAVRDGRTTRTETTNPWQI